MINQSKNSWRWLLITLWLIYTVILGALYSRLPPCPDDPVYDYVGWIISKGGTLYVDAADDNWPGMYLIHTLSTLLFGNTLWSFHLFDYFILLATCALLFTFTHRYFGLLPGLIIVTIYQEMYVSEDSWFEGKRDIAPLLLAAALSLLLRIETGRLVWSIVQGICLALATLFRPTFLLLTLLLAVGDLLLMKQTRRNLKVILHDHFVTLLSLVAVFIGFALIGWQNGALREWYNVTIRFTLEVYSQEKSSITQILARIALYAFASWYWYIFISVFGIVIYWRTRLLPITFLSMIFLTTVTSVLVQGKGFEYHWGPLLPLFAIFMAPLVAASIQHISKRPRKSLQMMLSILICCIVSLGLTIKIWHNLHDSINWYLGKESTIAMLANFSAGDSLSLSEANEISSYIEQTVPENRTVLYWGRPMIANYLSQRRSPTRFAGFVLLDRPRESFSLFKAYKDELKKDLSNSPPELICVELNLDKKGYKYQFLPDKTNEPRLSDLVLDTMKARYKFDRNFGITDCYRINHLPN